MKLWFTILSALILYTQALASTVLVWGVGETDFFGSNTVTIDGIPIREYLDIYQASISDWSDENNWFGTRVSVTDNGWGESIILNVWGEDEYSNPEEWDCEYGIELGDSGSGYWGAHWNQSNIRALDGYEITDSMLFIIQIGMGEYDEDLDELYWNTIAESTPAYMKSELSAYTYEGGSIAPPGYTPWMPTTYTTSASVPEPNVMNMIVIGLGLMVIRKGKFTSGL